MSAYGLDECREANERAGDDWLIDLHGQQRRGQETSQHDVRLAERELVRVELRHEEHGQPGQHRLRSPSLRQSPDRPAHERGQQASREREPDHLRHFAIEPRERRHRQRERRQILELIVPVVAAIERFGRDGAGAGRAIDAEIDHFRANLRREEDGRQRDEERRPEEGSEAFGHDERLPDPEPKHDGHHRLSHEGA